MATYETEPTPALPTPPPLGPEGERCGECGAPLAADQRYCLDCGAARAHARVELEALYAPVTPPPAPPRPPAPPGAARGWLGITQAGLVYGVAATACAFISGLVLGLIVNGDDPQPVAQKAPVVNVSVPAGAPAAGAAATPAPATVTPDWPAGQEGWTVQLECLPKDGTTPDQVAAAKASAASNGAAAPGVIDTDGFASLPPGSWCVYSGTFTAKQEATAAATALQGTIPAAEAVEVSTKAAAKDENDAAEKLDDAELEAQQNADPDTFQKQSKKLDKAATDGPPPPTDDEPPGGGGESETFE